MAPPGHFSSLLRARRGYLATIGQQGDPRVVPVCFTWAGDQIWTAIDGKPKTTDIPARVRDIRAHPKVAFTVDRWDEDWSRLAWLQARGRGVVLPEGPEAERARAALRDKYPQYQTTPLHGLVIRVDIDQWVGWDPESVE
ncbi:MAG TPA: TIGR03668 family PPOX class F420-dependent oxidoreductase [Actinomycetota bacterium]|nr:TIGR03668 family PPOX class F420-dependent oxidoreductase [Actinomycetota bacterium]